MWTTKKLAQNMDGIMSAGCLAGAVAIPVYGTICEN